MLILEKTSSVKEKHAKCVVCEKSENVYLYTVNAFPIVKCASCGFVFSRQYLEPVDFSKLYNQDYFHGKDYINYLADAAIIKRNFKNFLKRIKSYHPTGRLLEVGSAYGFFLDVAKNDYQCTGQEISKDGADYARGKNLNVLNDDLIDLRLEAGGFDLAVMWDTIEHLQHPDRYLAEIHRVLKSKGYFFLTTGNIDGIVPKIKNQQWRLMNPPWHLHYFSKRTIARLLERLGFEVLDISSVGFHRSFDMIFTKVLSEHSTAKRLFGHMLSALKLKSKSIYLNLYDIMFVAARKRG